MTEKKIFRADAEDGDMPLPSDPRTFFLGALFLLACLAALSVGAEIALPFVLAIVLKFLLQPLVRLMERLRIPRSAAALLAVLMVLGVFGGTITMLAGPAAAWAGKLPDAIPKLRDSFRVLHGPIDAAQHMMHEIEGITGGASPQQAPVMRPFTIVKAVLSGSAAATSTLFTTLLILFYLLVDSETFLRRMVEILPRFRDKRNAVEISGHIEEHISAYLLTVACINAIVGTATGIIMWTTGVANPLLWGVIAFILNFVPILGPMVGIVVFLMASVLSFGVVWYALLPVGLYLGIHIAEGEIITPRLLARRFTINPVAVVLSLIFWYWMWGVAGAILSFPLLAATKIACDDIRPLRAFGHLLEG